MSNVLWDCHGHLPGIFAGSSDTKVDYKQQAAFTKELGRLQGVLSNLSSLKALVTEVSDLSDVEAGSKEDPELRQMAIQERKLLEDQVGNFAQWLQT